MRSDACLNCRSHDVCCQCTQWGLPELAGERLEVLHDGGEVELIACPGEAA